MNIAKFLITPFIEHLRISPHVFHKGVGSTFPDMDVLGRCVIFAKKKFFFTNIHELQDCRGRGRAFD